MEDAKTLVRQWAIEALEHRTNLIPFVVVLAGSLIGRVTDETPLHALLALILPVLILLLPIAISPSLRVPFLAAGAVGYFLAFGHDSGITLLRVFLVQVSMYAAPPLIVHLMLRLPFKRHRLLSAFQPLHLYWPTALMVAGAGVVLSLQKRAGLPLTGFGIDLVPLIYWALYGLILFLVLLGFIGGMAVPSSAEAAPEQRARGAEELESEGRFTAAGRVYAKEGRIDKSAEMARKAGDWLVAADRYRQLGDHYNSAEMYFRAGALDEAIEMYEKSRAWAAAARVSEQAGQAERAAGLYEKAGSAADAIRVLDGAGKSASPELYYKAGMFEKASDGFRAAGNPMRAAEILETDLGRREAAAELYGAAGHHARAGELYEAAGKIEDAVKAYRRSPVTALHAAQLSFGLHEIQLAREIVEENQSLTADDPAQLLLARVLFQQRHVDEAIRTLQKLKGSTEAAGAVFMLLGQCFMAKGLPELAEEELRRASQADLGSAENLECQYHLARVLETLGKQGEAVEIYHAIMRSDLYYKDAEARYRHLKQQLGT